MVDLDHLDDIVVVLLPVNEMLDVEVEANDVGDGISPLDAI